MLQNNDSFTRTRLLLGSLLLIRPTKAEIADRGIIDDSGMVYPI